MRWAVRLTGGAICLALAVGVCLVWLDPRFSYFVDDGPAHAIRAHLVDHALRGGDWYPRWLPDLQFGFGYPVLNYYSPGVYFLAEPLQLLGRDAYRALQWVGAFATMLGAVGAYVLGQTLLGSTPGAMLVSAAYVLAPYPFITNLYLRTALPEALALGVVPWLLAGAVNAARRPGLAALLGVATAAAALILAHTLSVLLWLPVVVALFLAAAFSPGSPNRALAALTATAGGGLGLALAAFFWLPAAAELTAVHADLGRESGEAWLFTPLSGWALSDLLPFDTALGYPFTDAGVHGPQKPSLGQAALIAAAALTAAMGRRRRKRSNPVPELGGRSAYRLTHMAVPGVAVVLVAGPLLLNSSWSAPLWSRDGPLSVFQFPWRFYGMLALGTAILAGWLLVSAREGGRQRWLVALGLVAFLGVNSLGTQPWRVRDHDPRARMTWPAVLRSHEGQTVGASTTTNAGEYLPRSVELSRPRREGVGGRSAYEDLFPEAGWIAGRVWPYLGSIDVLEVTTTPHTTIAEVDVVGQGSAELAFRTLVFPGWRATVDAAPAVARAAPYVPEVSHGHGFAIVTVPAGRHTVRLHFGSTGPRAFGTALSATALALLVALTFGAARRPQSRLAPIMLSSASIGGLALLAVTLLAMTGAPASIAARVGPPPSRLVYDLLARAPLSDRGPSGVRLGPMVQSAREAIGGHERRWLYTPTPSNAEFPLDVPPRAAFRAGLGVDPRAWDESAAGGVRFLVQAEDAGRTETLLDVTLQPASVPTDRGWRFAHVDLGRYGRRSITLRLRTEMAASQSAVGAGWATPAVYVDGTARFPMPTAVSPAMRSGSPG